MFRRSLALFVCCCMCIVALGSVAFGPAPSEETTEGALGTRMLPTSIDLSTEWTYNTTFLGADKDDNSGSVIVMGDFNGDSMADLAIGAAQGDGKDNIYSNGGEVYLKFGASKATLGSARMMPTDADAWFYVPQSEDNLGMSMAMGDIDNDNKMDLIIGAPFGDGPSNSKDAAGDVHVIWGGSLVSGEVNLLSFSHLTIYGAEQGDYLGMSVAAGDVNGDGYDDIIMGANFADGPTNTRSNAGEVFVIFGNTQANLGSVIDLQTYTGFVDYMGVDAGDSLGISVASGDLNGDGRSDIIMGASKSSGPNNTRSLGGEVQVIFGKSSFSPGYIDLKDFPEFVIYGGVAGEKLGNDLAIGDIDGDAKDDLIIAAKAYGNLKGKVYALFGDTQANLGTTKDLLTQSDFSIYSSDESLTGDSIACGDINHDLADDIIIGCSKDDGPGGTRDKCGAAKVLYGQSRSHYSNDMDISTAYDLVIYGPEKDDWLGTGVGVGDINGDGKADLVAGAPGADSIGTLRSCAGESYLIYGDDFSHRPKLLRYIPTLYIDEDSKGYMDMHRYFADFGDFSYLSFSISGGAKIISNLLANSSYEFSAPKDYFGSETFSIVCKNKGVDGIPGNSDDQMVTSNDFLVTFRPRNDPPVIDTDNKPTALEDQLYYNIYQATDIDGNTVHWDMDTNASWLSLSGSNLSGTPAQKDVGTYWVNVTADDYNGSTVFTNFTMTVDQTQDPPQFKGAPAKFSFFEDTWAALELNTSAIDPDGDPVLFYLTNKSEELYTVTGENESSRLNFTSKKDAFGTNVVILWAVDPYGNSASTVLPITVIPVNDPPTAKAISASVDGGNNLKYRFSTLTAEDIDSEELTYTWHFGDGYKDDTNNKAPFHTYTKAGNYVVALNVSDGKDYDIETYYLNITTPGTDDDVDDDVVEDSDSDGMLDSWEIEHFGNLSQKSGGDYDKDGFTNKEEQDAKTDPADKDSHPTVVEPDDDDSDGGVDPVLIGGIIAVLVVVVILVIVIVLVMRSANKKKEERRKAQQAALEAERREYEERQKAKEPKAVDPNEVQKYMDMFSEGSVSAGTNPEYIPPQTAPQQGQPGQAPNQQSPQPQGQKAPSPAKQAAPGQGMQRGPSAGPAANAQGAKATPYNPSAARQPPAGGATQGAAPRPPAQQKGAQAPAAAAQNRPAQR